MRNSFLVRRFIRRILQTLFVVWAASTLAFVLLRMAPGDPYTTRLDGFPVSSDLKAQWKQQRGLNEPIAVQYLIWIKNVSRGELGWSTLHQRPVAEVFRAAIPPTLLLMGLALLTSVILGSAIGAWQGSRSGSNADNNLSALTVMVYSIPEFWLALLLLHIFSLQLGWFPATGMTDALHSYMSKGQRIADIAKHLVLPWLSLSLVGTAIFARYQRSAMIEAWKEPFVRTAKAKGLSEFKVIGHAWQNALVPVVVMIGLAFPALLGGAVFVERIYAWPGMGHTVVMAVGARDYELVTASVILGSAMTAAGSLLADLIQHSMDPR